MKTVLIYCDGSGVAGGVPCGYAAILCCDGKEREVIGSQDVGTNNVAEIMAAVIGLESLSEPSRVTIRSDSKYVVNAFALNWIAKWQQNRWQRLQRDDETNEPVWRAVPNAAYWQRLVAATALHVVTFEHVKGHNGDLLNERCDRLAKKVRRDHGLPAKAPLPLAYDPAGNRV